MTDVSVGWWTLTFTCTEKRQRQTEDRDAQKKRQRQRGGERQKDHNTTNWILVFVSVVLHLYTIHYALCMLCVVWYTLDVHTLCCMNDNICNLT